MKINGRKVGGGALPLVVAEIGINHGGDLVVAKNMALQAFRAGAECVKHQTHVVDDEMTSEAKSIKPDNADSSIWDVIAGASLTLDEERELKKFCDDLGLIYLSTPFSRSAADFLNSLNIPAFKIGSGECCNLPLVDHIASFGKPVIMSTGMHSIEEIAESVEILMSKDVEVALLQCTNVYPTPPGEVSLMGISELQLAFPTLTIGYSCHAVGPYMALAAVALGAAIIERHFTDSRYRVGPDICCSMDPAELRLLKDRGEEIHLAIRNPKGRSSGEENVYKFARGSVVAEKFLSAGATISSDDIWARRPGNGEIPANKFREVVGKRLKTDLKKNQQIRWSDLED